MAVTNYTDLQSSVADWLHRDDLTSAIQTFIQFAEKQMSRELRLKNQETTVSAAATTTIALPADYVEMILLEISSGGSTWPLRQRDRFSGSPLGNSTSTATYYTIEGSNFIISPAPAATATYSLQYYAAIPALSGGSPTNWLITAHPDLYLYATLIQSGPYLEDDGRLAVWQTMYAQLKAAAELQDQKDRFSGSPMAQRAQMSCW